MSNSILSVLDSIAERTLLDALKSTDTADRKWVKATDLLTARGITSSRLALDKDTKEKEKTLHHQVNRIIYASFGEVCTKLMAKDTATLSEKDKATKKRFQQKRGARWALIVSYLTKAERVESQGEDKAGKGARVTRTKADRIKKHISQALEILRSLEEAEFDITLAIADLTKTYKNIK